MNKFILIKNFRAFSIHSQACEAGISDIQLHQLKQEDTKNLQKIQNQTSVLHDKNGASNYMTFHDSKNETSSEEVPKIILVKHVF